MHELTSSDDAATDWDRVRPVLDEALHELNDADREAVLLRYFERRPFAEIGATLKVGEDAARMRVDRALEKLRTLLSRRNVTSTAAALGLVLTEQAAGSAPLDLAPIIARHALTEVAAVGVHSTLTARMVTFAKLPMGAAVSVGLVLLLATLGWWAFVGRDEDKSKPSAEIASAPRVLRAAMPIALQVRPVRVVGKAFDPTTETQPNATNDFLEQGWKYEQAKQYDLALAAFTTAIELDPKRYEGYFSRAGIHDSRMPIKDRDYAKAIADYTHALDINPRDVSARHNRALDYEQLREFDKAIADFTTIVESDADFSALGQGRDKRVALALEYRGRVYHDQHDFAAAIADYDEALRIDPEIAMVYYRRALAHQALKQYDAAEANFSAAYDRDPEYPNLLAGWAWQLATATEARYRDGGAALKLALKVNEKFGFSNAEHLDVLAAAYAENGRFSDAVATERKALSVIATYQAKLRPVMQSHLAAYEAGLPFRDR